MLEVPNSNPRVALEVTILKKSRAQHDPVKYLENEISNRGSDMRACL